MFLVVNFYGQIAVSYLFKSLRVCSTRDNLLKQVSSSDAGTINLGNSVVSFFETDSDGFRFDCLFEKAISGVCFSAGPVLYHPQ